MTLFKINNINVRIHYFMVLVILLYGILGYWAQGLILLMALIIHELAHIYVIIKTGIIVEELELYPFGGVAKLNCFIGHDPNQESIISGAGPFINLMIAAILFVIELKFPNRYINYAFQINLYIGGFNMLPILPLDGGRMLRACLSCRYGFKQATKYTIGISYIFIIALFIYGWYDVLLYKEGFYWILLSIFLMIAARKEKDMAAFIFMKDIIGKRATLKKKGIMKSHILVAFSKVTAQELMNQFLPNKYHIIIVINDAGGVLGTLYEEKLVNGILTYGMDVSLETLLNKVQK